MADDAPAVLPAPPLPDLVQRYLDGESLQTLAQESNRSPRTLYHWLLSDCGDAYHDVITQGLINRIADADVELGGASTPIQIARAREIAKFARMDFERRRPKLYGPKQETAIDASLTIIIKRDPQHIDAEPSTIDGQGQVVDITE